MARLKSLYRVKKAITYLKHFGWKQFWIHVRERFQFSVAEYGKWYESHKASSEALCLQREKVFPYQPLISIVVPVYNTEKRHLEEMLESVRGQSYEHWELCIANANLANTSVQEVLTAHMDRDNRIRVVEVPENKGIAQNTNRAIAIATGDYVGFLDHDDLLAPDALYEIVNRINQNREIDLLYTDEDKIREDGSEHFQPHFKPEFNLDLLRSNNYICHFCVIRRSLLEKLGGIREQFNGAQDHDLVLRCAEKAKGIARIPRVLYHWRVHSTSTADNPISKMYAYEAGKHAIEEHLKRCGEKAEVFGLKDLGFYRVKYQVQGNPLVSIIIPNKDHVEDLEKCLKSINKSNYENYEVIIVENNSTEKSTFDFYESIQSEQVKVVTWEQGFNYAAINNFGVNHAKGEYLLFLNNDIEALNEDWIEVMLADCQRENVGIVGAKLYYPNNKVQHAGVIIGIGGVAGHAFLGLSREFSGYLHKASIQQNLSAVTAACMMVKRSTFEMVDGFTEDLAVAFNDVDFCLKVRQQGSLIVFEPCAELVHYESKSRGAEDTEEKMRRFDKECEYMKTKWKDILQGGDPMYNPNLTLKKWDYSLKK